MSSTYSKSKIIAVLGPTNTGKTHLAMERLLAHQSGMIGFPLRLLARENYERAVRSKGHDYVALITGEEKIIPSKARWWICTVEAMPIDKKVDFVAVDEIQLAADRERGHIFTQRLLFARGTSETMFMGATTIRSILNQLLPESDYIERPRLSVLSHTGYRKISRLPKRSAIIAFSFEDVYRIADLLRHQCGGTSIVMGGLSPRTRNAQVEMYQSGEVDYLVATDAIGMGLNMDIHHVAFAKLQKFDGRYFRSLTSAEIAQIAGRAGRQLTNGSFGSTDQAGLLDASIVDSVENHRFDQLEQIEWRNHQLDFTSPSKLLHSLDQKPAKPLLKRSQEADDQRSLSFLIKDPEILKLCQTRQETSLLWEVCQIPDFRKMMTDAHLHLIKKVFLLLREQQHLPEDWVASQVERLNHTEGDIDTLMNRLGHIRTWTYISYRPSWLSAPQEWQEKTRLIEDKLSDALHRQLTQRFVDRRRTVLAKHLSMEQPTLAGIQQNGQVVVEGYPIGWLHGFRFIAEPDQNIASYHQLHQVARRALRQEIDRRIATIRQSANLTLDDNGYIYWENAQIALVTKGKDILSPLVRVIADDLVEQGQNHLLSKLLEGWLNQYLRNNLPMLYLNSLNTKLPALGRGLLFQLQQSLGFVNKSVLDELGPELQKTAPITRKGLFAIGKYGAWLYGIFQPNRMSLRTILWRTFFQQESKISPPTKRLFYVNKKSPHNFYQDIGYHYVNSFMIRCDMLEKIELYFDSITRQGDFQLSQKHENDLQVTSKQLPALLKFLGYRLYKNDQGEFYRRRHKISQAKPSVLDYSDDSSPFAILKNLGTD